VICSCATPEPLGSAANPFRIHPGSSWSVWLWFWRVGPSVVVTTTEDEPDCDAEAINLSSPARTGSAELRPTTDHVGDPIANLTVSIDTPQSGQRRGRVTVTLAPAESVYPQITPRLYVFDVRLVANADATDVLGSHVFHVSVLEGATR
jgi:hypothetical protein